MSRIAAAPEFSNLPGGVLPEMLRSLTIIRYRMTLPHLSKRPSDLKQNGTPEKTPFSGTVFHTLSHDVFCFVASVSFKNQ